MFGGDRFPYHGHFVPGSANGIGFEDLVVIEDYEFCRAVAEGRPFRPASRRRVQWVSVQDALLRSRERPLGGRVLGRDEPGDAVRMGVIGVGRIGSMHAELLARQVPGAEVTCGQRRAYPATAATAARLRVASGSVDELLAAPDVDAVAICTSPTRTPT